MHSIALHAVTRVMASYVESSPGRDFEPLTMILSPFSPLLTSNRSPTACTTASASLTNCSTVALSVASPDSQVTPSRSSESDGGSPRRLSDLTVYPRRRAALQTSDPTKPVPPSTASFLGAADIDIDDVKASLTVKQR